MAWTGQNAGSPSPDGISLAYDSLHHEFVALDTAGTTWTGDGITWLRRTPPNSPSPARAFASMAFDGSQVVLFGGAIPGAGERLSTALDDTWTWDGSTWTLQKAANHPFARYAASMAHDPRSSGVVLVAGIAPGQQPCPTVDTIGGATGFSAVCADPSTWVWNGQSGSWTQHPVPGPTPRYAASMALDPRSGRLLLFGGENDSTGARLGDTWSWDGSDQVWTEAAGTATDSPLTGGPPARGWAGMAPDPNGIVLFGGDSSSDLNGGSFLAGDSSFDLNGGSFLGDTWHWDGRAWSQLSPAKPPSPRQHVQLASVDGAAALLFGGLGCVGDGATCSPALTIPVADTTWAWDGTAWSRAPSAPLPRDLAASAYDPISRSVLLVGGRTAADGFNGGAMPLADSATWDGTAWNQIATGPTGSYGSGAAFDAATGKVVFFGGVSMRDTWSWDGSSRRWTQLHPAHNPSLQPGLAMAYDAANRQVVLFGIDNSGTGLAVTWTWDGDDWTARAQAPATAPPGRAFAAMTYDAAGKQTVLFGGIDPYGNLLNDTWTWDGSTWTQLVPSAPPPARWGASLSFDAAVGRTVLFGGQTDRLMGDTWTWDGSTWTQLSTANAPSPRSGAVLTYDTTRQRLVLVGGSTAVAAGNLLEGDLANDNWTLDPAASPPALGALRSPAALDLGAQPTGRPSAPRMVTLTNVGTTPLSVSGAAITAGSADFSVTSDCPAILPSWAGCGVMVSFRSSGLGARSGALSLTDEAPDSPQVVTLSGTDLAAASGDAAALNLQGVTLFGGTAAQQLPDGSLGSCEAGPTTAATSTTSRGSGVPGCQGSSPSGQLLPLMTETSATETVTTGSGSAQAHSNAASLALLPGKGLAGADVLDVSGLDAQSSASCSGGGGATATGSSSIGGALLINGTRVATQPVGSQIVFKPLRASSGGPGYVRLYGNPITVNPVGGRIPMAIVTLNYSRYDPASNTEIASPVEVEFPPGGPLAALIVGRLFIGYASSGVHPCR